MFLVDVLSVLIGSSKLTPAELSTRRLHSRVDKWRHRGGMSCACPGRLEVSRGIRLKEKVTGIDQFENQPILEAGWLRKEPKFQI